MNCTHITVVACCTFVLGASPLVAQDLAKYRDYALESTPAEVVAASGARDADIKALHERPARIQELLWRAPYELSGRESVDPVLDLRFAFYDGRLYRVVVTYDRRRTEGLTNGDVIEVLSATYGAPTSLPAPAEAASTGLNSYVASTEVARWEDAKTVLTLTQGANAAEFRLTMSSKALDALAVAAIAEARRLDTLEAPGRDLDERNRQASERMAASEKARLVNKPAFRP